jgi:hypothetical protein
VPTVSTAKKDGGGAARPAVGRDLDPGLPGQQFSQARLAGSRDVIRTNDGDVGQKIRYRLSCTGSRHGYWIELGRFGWHLAERRKWYE